MERVRQAVATTVAHALAGGGAGARVRLGLGSTIGGAGLVALASHALAALGG
jgi:hypothetical protein